MSEKRIKAFHHKTTRHGHGHVDVLHVYPGVWKCLIWDRDERWAFVDINDLSFSSGQDVDAFETMLLAAVNRPQRIDVRDMPQLTGAFNTYPQC